VAYIISANSSDNWEEKKKSQCSFQINFSVQIKLNIPYNYERKCELDIILKQFVFITGKNISMYENLSKRLVRGFENF